MVQPKPFSRNLASKHCYTVPLHYGLNWEKNPHLWDKNVIKIGQYGARIYLIVNRKVAAPCNALKFYYRECRCSNWRRMSCSVPLCLLSVMYEMYFSLTTSVKSVSCSDWHNEFYKQWRVSRTQHDATCWTRLQPTCASLKLNFCLQLLCYFSGVLIALEPAAVTCNVQWSYIWSKIFQLP